MIHLLSFWNGGMLRKGLVVLIFLFLLLKVGFIAYWYVASGKDGFVAVSIPTQAIAQEEEPLEEAVVARAPVEGELEQESLSLLNKKRKELDHRAKQLKQEEERLNQLKSDIANTLESLTTHEVMTRG